MKILHYALGFPPYRTGGLTKFCIDLLCQQNRTGHQVALMWPGQMGFVSKRVSVKNRGIVTISGASITSLEVINPIPVSYDEGISDIPAFTKNVDSSVYEELLDSFRPDVIHIHTLMGLHKNFLSIAKKHRIRLVFTAHDFFPICPKVTMFRNGQICSSVQTCENCGMCNSTALSMKRIQILQSPVYRVMKNSPIVKKLRKQHRDAYLSESITRNDATPVGMAKDFFNLREYYGFLLQMVDIIHYNSLVTKQIYEKYFRLSNSAVISITHGDISDNRTKKNFKSQVLRIRYLGPVGRAKGFFA